MVGITDVGAIDLKKGEGVGGGGGGGGEGEREGGMERE